MPESASISTAIPNQSSLDYDHLRLEGLQQVERLARQLWTDYNAHDPGITMLEVMAYAITDLGLRTDWDIEDILASHAGLLDLGEDFYAQHEILPNHPWTPLDFRKLIIDFADVTVTRPRRPREVRIAVQNTWLRRAIPAEIPLYYLKEYEYWVGEEDDELYENQEGQGELLGIHISKECLRGVEPLPLNGLYETHLLFEENSELDPDDPLFDLNSNTIKGNVNQQWDYYLSFPTWDEWEQSFVAAQVTQMTLVNAFAKNPWKTGYQYEIRYTFGNNPKEFTAHLNLDQEEEFSLANVRPNSSRAYRFRVNNWAELMDYLLHVSVSPPQVVKAEYQQNGLYRVELDVFGPQNMDLFLECSTPWDDRDDRRSDDIRLRLEDPNEVEKWIQDRYMREFTTLGTLSTQLKTHFQLYQERLSAIREFVEGPQKQPEKGLRHYLCCHRNLCEDWVNFKQVPIEEIALECEVILKEGANPDDVLSQIWYQIDRFLSPMVQYQTLEELLAKGQDPTDIFEGPLLKHGFISDEFLKAETPRDQLIYTSDLLRIIMDIPGVEALHDLGISAYIEGRRLIRHAENCLELEQVCIHDPCDPEKVIRKVYRKPKLNHRRSVLKFSRAGLDLSDQVQKAEEMFTDLKMRGLTQRIPRSYAPVSLSGEAMDLKQHQSIQEDFPLVYGVGSEGLSREASDERKGQAKQMKGYLLFFDQLLANYLSQLTQMRDLFTFRDGGNGKKQSYFMQAPESVPDVSDLLPQYAGNWQDLLNDFESKLETEETFYDRRNRFLGHVMARFGESFSTYSAKLYTWYFSQTANTHDAEKETRERLLNDRKTLLLDYPVISSQRGKGFCIRKKQESKPDVWGTYNVTGEKRRVCRLLGISDYQRRYLTEAGESSNNDWQKEYVWEQIKSSRGIRWRLIGPDGDEILQTFTYSSSLAEAEAKKQAVLLLGTDPANYVVVRGRRWIKIFIRMGTERCALLLPAFDRKVNTPEDDELARVVDEYVQLFLRMLDSGSGEIKAVPEEGFHIIEHVLFRPLSEGDAVLKILPGNVQRVLWDVYSFRTTVILPGWAERFQNKEFRLYTEKVIREECPAHIQPWIIWVEDEPEQLEILHTFEKAYHVWLEEMCTGWWGGTDRKVKQIEVVNAFNDFISAFLYEDRFQN